MYIFILVFYGLNFNLCADTETAAFIHGFIYELLLKMVENYY